MNVTSSDTHTDSTVAKDAASTDLVEKKSARKLAREAKRRQKELAKRDQQAHAYASEESPNPVWFKPVMFGLMLAGLLWIILYYITLSLPLPAVGQGNILIGFGLIMAGFLMTTRWR